MQYNFEKLEVWQLGIVIVRRIYSMTRKFPIDEKFALVSQMRRAAISIPLNIAEGSGKRTKKDFASYIRNAIGSSLELITCLRIALEQKYITEKDYQEVNQLLEKLYFKLIALEKNLNKTS